jgi:hypothetical protein
VEYPGDYQLTTLDESAGAQRLCRFILGAKGSSICRPRVFTG